VENAAIDDPLKADDMTLARLVQKSVAGIRRGGPMLETYRQAIGKYARELCNRYEK
jgi:hypothetical protein